MEVDAPGAELREMMDGVDWVEWRTYELAERIASAIADGPQPKGEFVIRRWPQCHMCLPVEVQLGARDQQKHDAGVDHVPAVQLRRDSRRCSAVTVA